MERLEIPGSTATPEDLAAALRTNSRVLQEGLDRVGFNLLKAITTRTLTSMAASTKTVLDDLQCSVRTSGGLIVVYADVYIAVNNETQGAYLTLRVDDEEVKTSGLGTDAGLGATVPLMWMKEMPAGQHTFKLWGQATNATYGNANADSVLYVLELMRG
jgi:hypothetical protein